jgi:hypothetical protein
VCRAWSGDEWKEGSKKERNKVECIDGIMHYCINCDLIYVYAGQEETKDAHKILVWKSWVEESY